MSQKNKQDKKNRKTKIMAVASWGGHLVQLNRVIRPFESKYDIVYLSTAKEAKAAKYKKGMYVINDFSRSNWRAIFGSINMCRRIIKREKPDLVISTGAAPGLSAIIVAKMMGLRTLWIDSIANADRLSLCGRIASHIATTTLTQWPHLQSKRVKYAGTVL